MDDKDRSKVELPLDMAGWIELLKKTQAQIKELEDKASTAKAKIQEALGESELGLIEGRVVVRWTKVTTTRLDLTKAKEVLDPKVYLFLSRESESRRFTLVGADDN